jgi:hypothetical protein
MPAKYADLSKKGDDLFKKGFEHEHHKVEIAGKSDGVEFTTKGALKGGAVSASHEMKFNCLVLPGAKTKLTFTPGKNALACEYEYTKVAKLTACFSLPLNEMPVPNVNKVKLAWSNDKANVNLASNLGNQLDVDATVSTPHCNIGAKLGLDAKSMALNSKEVALHMVKGNITATVKSSLNSDFNAVIHNQVNDKLALATSVTHNSSGSTLALAGQQKACCGTTNNFKFANNGRFSISHVTPYMSCAKLTISGDFDATNLGGGSHKVGAGLKFDL